MAGTTKLAKWLKRTGTSQAALAKGIGFSEAQVSLWARGLCGASAAAALAVERVTGGKVTVRDLVRPASLDNQDAA